MSKSKNRKPGIVKGVVVFFSINNVTLVKSFSGGTFKINVRVSVTMPPQYVTGSLQLTGEVWKVVNGTPTSLLKSDNINTSGASPGQTTTLSTVAMDLENLAVQGEFVRGKAFGSFRLNVPEPLAESTNMVL